jgi:hypothetical protein
VRSDSRSPPSRADERLDDIGLESRHSSLASRLRRRPDQPKTKPQWSDPRSCVTVSAYASSEGKPDRLGFLDLHADVGQEQPNVQVVKARPGVPAKEAGEPHHAREHRTRCFFLDRCASKRSFAKHSHIASRPDSVLLAADTYHPGALWGVRLRPDRLQ